MPTLIGMLIGLALVGLVVYLAVKDNDDDDPQNRVPPRFR